MKTLSHRCFEGRVQPAPAAYHAMQACRRKSGAPRHSSRNSRRESPRWTLGWRHSARDKTDSAAEDPAPPEERLAHRLMPSAPRLRRRRLGRAQLCRLNWPHHPHWRRLPSDATRRHRHGFYAEYVTAAGYDLLDSWQHWICRNKRCARRYILSDRLTHEGHILRFSRLTVHVKIWEHRHVRVWRSHVFHLRTEDQHLNPH